MSADSARFTGLTVLQSACPIAGAPPEYQPPQPPAGLEIAGKSLGVTHTLFSGPLVQFLLALTF
jgi:hypothetical protein